MRSQKPSFVTVDLHAHVPQEATDSHSSNSSSSSSSSKPRTIASVSFAEQQVELYSSNSSLSVQSSGPMDLVSASCNISSLRDVELTEDDRMGLSALLSGHADQEVLIHKYNIPMTREKISCLKPGTWLNDEVINFYVEMMMQEGGSIHSFNTFFMVRLYQNENYNFNNVARWTKKVDIFRQKKVFIPINYKNEHWVLVVIDLTIKTIFFYDGYKGNGDTSYDAPLLSITLKVLLSMIT
jgi:Ulp1 family protease